MRAALRERFPVGSLGLTGKDPCEPPAFHSADSIDEKSVNARPRLSKL